MAKKKKKVTIRQSTFGKSAMNISDEDLVYKKESKSPFDYMNDIFAGRVPDDISSFNPVFTLSFLSFHDDFLYICDIMNRYIYDLPKDLLYKLFVVFFRGTKTYVKYTKKHKAKEDEEVKDQIKQLYSWSDNELRKNFKLLTMMDVVALSKRIGLEKKKIEKFFKDFG